ncbi:MAG: VCBS repeat-containing protein [Planctomycetota bacterium]
MSRDFVTLAMCVALCGTTDAFDFDHPVDASAVADFDEDGIDDLAALTMDDASFRVLSSDANGELFEVSRGRAARNAILRAIDLDGDGHMDLVATGGPAGVISYGAGDGSFSDSRELRFGLNVRSLAIGDLNGDERLDLAAVGGSRGELHIRFGSGDREFSESLVIESPVAAPHVVALPDLDQDGDRDIIVWGRDPKVHVIVYKNEAGSWHETILSDAFLDPDLREPRGAVVDIDRDGREEVLLVLEELGSSTTELFVVEEPNGGSVRSRRLGSNRGILTNVADFDGDGFLDIVSIQSDVDGYARGLFRRNQANGRFEFSAPCVAALAASGETPTSTPAIADFDGDGKTDAVFFRGHQASLSRSTVDLCRAEVPCFEAPRERSLPGIQRVASGDLWGDSRSEVVTVSLTQGHVWSFPSGEWSLDANFEAPLSTRDIAIADFDRNGAPDLALLDSANGVISLRYREAPRDPSGFASRRDYEVGPHPHSMTYGDFNRDGIQDFAVALSGRSRIALLISTDAAEYGAPVELQVTGNPRTVASGDLNGDGFIDLVSGSAGASEVSLFEGSGDGNFFARRSEQVVRDPQTIVLRDLNGDGLDDIIAASRALHSITLLLRRSDGNRPRPQIFPLAANALASDLIISDLSGDGIPDILTANGGSRSASFFRGRPDGTYPREFSRTLELEFDVPNLRDLSLDTADVDSDGFNDLLVADAARGSLIFYRSLGCDASLFTRGDADDDQTVSISDAVTTLRHLFLAAATPRCSDAADFDDDGRLTLSDPIGTLRFLFLSGPAPIAPFPIAGNDPTLDGLDCRRP